MQDFIGADLNRGDFVLWSCFSLEQDCVRQHYAIVAGSGYGGLVCILHVYYIGASLANRSYVRRVEVPAHKGTKYPDIVKIPIPEVFFPLSVAEALREGPL